MQILTGSCNPKISAFNGVSGPYRTKYYVGSHTGVPAKWYFIPSSDFNMVHEGDRRTDRWTDQAAIPNAVRDAA